MTVTPVANWDNALRKWRVSNCGGSALEDGVDIEDPENFCHYAEKEVCMTAGQGSGRPVRECSDPLIAGI
ncbi:hypothetical protein GCM10027343_06030 [Noviherbaspirillum agri]